MTNIRLIVIVAICLVAAAGAVLVGWGIYREVHVSGDGLVLAVLGGEIMFFAVIAISITEHYLFHAPR